MNRTITYNITEPHAGLRVEQYLRRLGYSNQSLTELKKRTDTTLIGGTACRLKQRLAAGDTLEVRIAEPEYNSTVVPTEIPLHIVYEDADILVVQKPAGLPIHPSRENLTYSLANAVVFYYRQQGIPFVFRCTNRLDRDTSGLTVVAKHYVSAGILAAMVKGEGNGNTRMMEREYLAVVRGTIVPPCGTIQAPLSRKPGRMIERTVDFAHGEYAATHYRVIENASEKTKGHSLVSLCLGTGRTHQIRIHMKYLGHPLVGDYLYNPDMEYISRQALHAWRLKFPHPMTGDILEFTAPLPADMRVFGFQIS